MGAPKDHAEAKKILEQVLFSVICFVKSQIIHVTEVVFDIQIKIFHPFAVISVYVIKRTLARLMDKHSEHLTEKIFLLKQDV